MSTQQKQNVLMIVPGFIPSTIIGVMRPLAVLARQKEVNLRLRLANFSPFLASDLKWCDIAVFTRNCEIGDLELLYELKRQGKKVIYDIDDNFEEIPLSSDVAIYHRAFYRLHVVRRFFELADVVRVYSDRMADRARLRGAQPEFVRCYFDADLVKRSVPRRQDGILKIAYPTGRLDDRQLENMLYSAVASVLKKYVGKVEFHLWRKEAPEKLKGVPGVVLNKPVSGYDNFIRAFHQAGFDIGLGPGVDTPFFRSKTNNKYREFGGCGIAGVYSNFPPYSNTIEDGVTGLLVDSSVEAWINGIERLLDDERLRRDIVSAAREDVAANYSFAKELDGWRRAILRAQNASATDMSWMPDYGSWNLAVINPPRTGARPQDIEGEREFSVANRLRHIDAAASALQRIKIMSFSSGEEYLGIPTRRGFGAALFLVDTSQDFENCVKLLSLGNSAIIDFSGYQDDVLPLIRRLSDLMIGIEISCLVRKNDAPNIVELNLPQIAIHEIDFDRDIFPNYSLEGYPAIYANIIEQHVRYMPFKEHGRFKSVRKAYGRTTNVFAKNKRRFLTLWKYICWRLGRETF